jgi:cyclic beta-1,2-glucan synthetase
MPQDEQILNVAEKGIQELNARYPHPEIGRKFFHLFVRRRLWNASEGKWIGWERKRGKLHEFNKLMRGATDTTFTVNTADLELLKKIKNVITLDSDTQLPRDVARSLIGIISHPLNQPYFDEAKGRVTKGYGILQPRVSITHSSSSRTYFSKIFSGNTGLDPYTTAVSDVYQDLFNEGIYTGKGLYVVDVFEKSLEKRIPENSLLSHDLFESSYARAALVTDLEFFDDYPSDFDSYAKRQHRWTRGDWQIAQWLLPRVPTEDKSSAVNTLSVISKWKIFDNLRRSLAPTFLLLWLIFMWGIPFLSPGFGTAVFLFVIIFPAYAPLTNSVLFRRRGVPWRGHFRNIGHEAKVKFAQVGLTIAILPNLAWIQCDAIVRTLYRKIISKKKPFRVGKFCPGRRCKKHSKCF